MNEKPSENPVIFLGGFGQVLLNLVDALPLLLVIATTEGKILHINPYARQLIQPTSGGPVGKTIPHYEPDENRQKWEFRSAHGLKHFEFNVIPLKFAGETIHVLTTGKQYPSSNHHRSNEELINHLFENSNDGIVLCDQKLRLIEWNKGMETITGYSADEVIGMKLGKFLSLISPDPVNPITEFQILQGHMSDAITLLTRTQKSLLIEREIRAKSDSCRTVEYRMFPVFIEGSILIGALVRDITNIKQAEEILQATEMRYRTLIEAMGEGVLMLDRDLNIIFANPAADAMYGAGLGYLVGRNIREFINPEQEPYIQETTRRTADGISNRFELDMADYRGNSHTILITTSPWRGAKKEIRGSIVIVSDITEMKIAEDHLRFISSHDEMSQLYNRNYYEEEKARLNVGRRFPVSVVIIDLDDFKSINDSLGHEAGDLLLKVFGEIIRQAFRSEDVVARIGGDEFAVLLPETDKPTVLAAVQRLRDAVACHNTTFPERPIYFSAGTGTAKSAGELDDAVRRADNRMYREKKQKKGISN